jgi:hypothetical protein
MVSFDSDIESYVLNNVGFEGALIPYGGTEKKVKVCVINLMLPPSNPCV